MANDGNSIVYRGRRIVLAEPTFGGGLITRDAARAWAGLAMWCMCAEPSATPQDVGKLRAERDLAIAMLADWCVAVNEVGTSWDDWDGPYKDAAYRPCAIRTLLDSAIAERSTKESSDE